MAAIAPLVQNETLSHGTVECSDMVATRRFLTEFLGLDVHRPVKAAQYMYKGGPWAVVCVCVDGGAAKDQTQDNHFKVAVATPAEVDEAHAAAIEHKEKYGIKKVDAVGDADGVHAFRLQDLNSTWWEIASTSLARYDAIFDRGDAVAPE
jgi:catechol 2,3-dioxygenase-like lactoylglutathione lyase family enzyme